MKPLFTTTVNGEVVELSTRCAIINKKGEALIKQFAKISMSEGKDKAMQTMSLYNVKILALAEDVIHASPHELSRLKVLRNFTDMIIMELGLDHAAYIYMSNCVIPAEQSRLKILEGVDFKPVVFVPKMLKTNAKASPVVIRGFSPILKASSDV